MNMSSQEQNKRTRVDSVRVSPAGTVPRAEAAIERLSVNRLKLLGGFSGALLV